MPFQITLSGRLTDPLGSGISGAQVLFTAKATTKGPENVAKTADASFTTDADGYYSALLASGWYKIDYKEPDWLDFQRLGVATVSGTDSPLDLGTLIGNSVPPPSQLEDISDVSVSGRSDGSAIVWNAARRKWTATGAFVPAASQRVISTAIPSGTSGIWVPFTPAFPTAPKVQMSAAFTGLSQWLAFPRAVSVSGVSGHFSAPVTEAGGVLYTFANN